MGILVLEFFDYGFQPEISFKLCLKKFFWNNRQINTHMQNISQKFEISVVFGHKFVHLMHTYLDNIL